MKDIYLDMSSQNILKFYGTRLDAKLDTSELYDYEISKVTDDYNKEVLDLSTPITYDSLKIDDSLYDFSCSKSTISLEEYDNRVNDPEYVYSGLTAILTYDDFVNHISPIYKNIVLNTHIFEYTGITNETHLMSIVGFNNVNYFDPRMGASEAEVISGFTSNFYKCSSKIESQENCCEFPPTFIMSISCTGKDTES